MTKKKSHLIAGIRVAACGAKIDWKKEIGTVFLSQVTCRKCKTTNLHQRKSKKCARDFGLYVITHMHENKKRK